MDQIFNEKRQPEMKKHVVFKLWTNVLQTQRKLRNMSGNIFRCSASHMWQNSLESKAAAHL